MTKTSIIQELKKNKVILASKYNVKKLGLFGSFARGENTRSSDIDILVEFSAPVDLFKYIDLEDHLKRILKRKIDLVSRKAIKPMLKSNILREAIYI